MGPSDPFTNLHIKMSCHASTGRVERPRDGLCPRAERYPVQDSGVVMWRQVHDGLSGGGPGNKTRHGFQDRVIVDTACPGGRPRLTARAVLAGAASQLVR